MFQGINTNQLIMLTVKTNQMRNVFFITLSLVVLGLTSCKKEKDAFGVHTMTSSLQVISTGETIVKTNRGDKAEATASMKRDGKMELILQGNSDVFEQLNILIDHSKPEYKGVYTLKSKDVLTNDAFVTYFRTKTPSGGSSNFQSDMALVEGSLDITDYDGSDKRQTITGNYRIIFRNVMHPDANQCDITITGTFEKAWLVK